MKQALDVLVAIHAGKHGAMDRMTQFLGVDVQADRLSIYFSAQGGIRVTGKTVFILELLLSVRYIN